MWAVRTGVFLVSLAILCLATALWAASGGEDATEALPVWNDPGAGPALRGESGSQANASLAAELFGAVGRGFLARNQYSFSEGLRWLPLSLAGGRIRRVTATIFVIEPLDEAGLPVGPRVWMPITEQRGARHFELERHDAGTTIATVEFVDVQSPVEEAGPEEQTYHKRACDILSLLRSR